LLANAARKGTLTCKLGKPPSCTANAAAAGLTKGLHRDLRVSTACGTKNRSFDGEVKLASVRRRAYAAVRIEKKPVGQLSGGDDQWVRLCPAVRWELDARWALVSTLVVIWREEGLIFTPMEARVFGIRRQWIDRFHREFEVPYLRRYARQCSYPSAEIHVRRQGSRHDGPMEGLHVPDSNVREHRFNGFLKARAAEPSRPPTALRDDAGDGQCHSDG
jgi:hypothetical protein